MQIPEDDYDLESFCQRLIDTDPSQLFEGFHFKQIKTYFYLTSTDDWIEEFEDNYQVEEWGDIYKITQEYTTLSDETGRTVLFGHYYESNLLMFFTASTEKALEHTLDLTITNSSQLTEMPIVPKDFLKMHQMVLNENPDAHITNFKADRIPDLAEAEIRPEVDRTIEYSGEDGRQTLNEFEQYYGVVPVRVQYEGDTFEIKIDKTGKFTLRRSNVDTFNLLFQLIEEVLDHILDIQEVSERIRFRTERRESGDLELEVANVTAGHINFEREFTRLRAENFMEAASSQDEIPFTFTDIVMEAGSIDFSAKVTDERRNANFNISATQDSMKIIPKHNCAFPTLVRFFQLVTETIDESAEIDVFDNEAAYTPSPA